jgi:hypothetical protein
MLDVAMALTIAFIHVIKFLICAFGVILAHLLLLKICVKLLGSIYGFILFMFMAYGATIAWIFILM